jgi:hypothetical protein
MSKGETDGYRQMSSPDVRRWLTASCVVATAFTAAILIIVIGSLGRDPGSADTQQAEAVKTRPAEKPALVLAEE